MAQTKPLQYAEVVLNLPLDGPFTYTIPPALSDCVRPGCRILVPFREREETGFVVARTANPPGGVAKLKCIHSLVDRDPVISAEMMKLARWMSEFYCASLGEVLSAISPPEMRREEVRFRVGLAATKEHTEKFCARNEKRAALRVKVLRWMLEHPDCSSEELKKECKATPALLRALASDGFLSLTEDDPFAPGLLWSESGKQAPIPELNPAQRKSVDAIREAIASSAQPGVFLLHGVTASGKTEVYLRVISELVMSGGQAIVLVPEISLTPQTIGRFRSRFPRLAVLHSAMGAGLRRRQWELAASGKADVVIGARSAVFAPLPNLKLIVVDEEHEPSYKQESTPRYSAREVAIIRAREAGAAVVLGSATPSLESWLNAKTGKFRLLEMPDRVEGTRLPEIVVVDMREERSDQKRNSLFSRKLISSIHKSLGDGKQVLLFLNRRGFHIHGRCSNCQAILKCPNCDICLTYHKQRGMVLCHLCGWHGPADGHCRECGTASVKFSGAGTERVEDVTAALFPRARIARMDADTTSRRHAHGEILGAFRRGEFDILLGTQMIAKGLDYPNITTVGVLDADVSLAFPDFRAGERTFQLLSQVAGRTGRGESPGLVVIQTNRPTSLPIRCAAEQDIVGFMAAELTERKAFGWPPYGRLCRLIARSEDPHAAMRELKTAADLIRERADELGVRILGPTVAPVARAESKYRYHMLLRSPSQQSLVELARLLRTHFKPCSAVTVVTDMNPMSVL